MDAKTINQTTEIIPLLGYELRKAGGYHVGACPFCGGRDRFTVKHTSNGDRWHCRHCGDGKYHTAIDYIMRRDNADFKTALKILGGDIQKTVTPRTVTPPPPKPLQIPAQDWQADAWREVDAASDELLYADNAIAQQAREFLAGRGINKAANHAWLLGCMLAFDPIAKRKRPVITIPWYDMDAGGEALTAVKYRFIDSDPNPKALRYSCKAGSKFDVPFGLWDILPDYHHSLLLIEGEFNCLSVWQCRPAGLSVLSFGSEGGGGIRALQALAKHYQHVYIWADDLWNNPKQAQRAEELRGLIRGKGIALQSPKRGGVKYDANQLLQVGALPEFLARVLKVEFD